MSVENLKCAGIVAAGTRLATTIIPPSGKDATVTAFCGKGEFSKDAYTAIIWDYGAADPNDEVFLHTEKGSGGMSQEDVQTVTGDGTKKLAVVCANSEPTSSLVMSSYATVDVEA